MKKMKDPSKNKHNLPILKSAPAETPALASETSDKPEEHHGLVVFATDEDRIKFWNSFGKDAYYRKVVRAKFGTTPVTYEQATEVAAPAVELLKELIDEKVEGPKGPCVQGEKCVGRKNPNSRFIFTWVPVGGYEIDWSDQLNPKRAVAKTWNAEELVTLMRVDRPDGTSKIYHVFEDGRVSKLEHNVQVFVSTDEAKLVMERGATIPKVYGRFFVDRLNRKVDGPLCFKCQEADLAKYGKKDAIRLMSKVAAEAELARFIAEEKANEAYQLQREAREKEQARASEGAIVDLHGRTTKPGYKYTGYGSRKTRDWGRDRSRREQ